ncbi:hypothetical protein ACET3Z_027963 [Daucus carota]
MELLNSCEVSRGSSNMKASTSNLSNGFLSLCSPATIGESSPKIVAGDDGYVFEDVPHFLDYIPKATVEVWCIGVINLGRIQRFLLQKHNSFNPKVDCIQDRKINQVYIIGGDGTQKGAAVIFEEIRRRGLKVAVAGIPKTIDNDIPVIDKSFGFDSAVEEAQRAINAAHVEAESTENGIGLVKLMGRYSGFIAMYATLASRDVDCCLIPESPFYLEGKGGLFEYIEKRLKENGHMVIVIAEGAGQELLSGSLKTTDQRDASGNNLLQDVGIWISQKIKDHFSKQKKIGQQKTTINLKYIDPTYMIRAIPSNASDNVYCTLLAQSAVHGAMAGHTGFTVASVNGRHAYIPFHCITEKQNKVVITDRMWARLLSSTHQPSFLSPKILAKQQG